MNGLLGQDSILAAIRKMLDEGKLPTSFLISGPRGSGRKTLARLAARGFNCEEGRFAESCLCPSCKRVDQGMHPEVHWLGLDKEASSIKIEAIHQLIHWAGYKTTGAAKKIFVLVDAERMTDDAANALLKTLEEPPAGTHIFLLAENPARLWETIVSRCFHIKMRPVPVESLTRALRERLSCAEEEARVLAKSSQGRFGRALELAGENFREMRRRFLEEVLRDPGPALEEWSGRKRQEIVKELEFFSLLLRDMLVYKETQDRSLLYHENIEPFFVTWTERLGRENLSALFEAVEETRRALEDYVNPKLAVFRLGMIFQAAGAESGRFPS